MALDDRPLVLVNGWPWTTTCFVPTVARRSLGSRASAGIAASIAIERRWINALLLKTAFVGPSSAKATPMPTTVQSSLSNLSGTIDCRKNMPRTINADVSPRSLTVFSKFGEYSMGMKKQLRPVVMHKSAQFISNVTKYASLIAEYPYSMWKVK